MEEFGDYLENLDPMERTDYAEGGAVFFTEKLIKDTTSKDGAIFVAEDNNNIVGFIGGYIHQQSKEELMESKKAKPGVISEFFVTKTYRKQGIGTKLLRKMENYFKSKNCTLIRLDVFAPNKLARDFYYKYGYQDRSIIISKDL